MTEKSFTIDILSIKALYKKNLYSDALLSDLNILKGNYGYYEQQT